MATANAEINWRRTHLMYSVVMSLSTVSAANEFLTAAVMCVQFGVIKTSTSVPKKPAFASVENV